MSDVQKDKEKATDDKLTNWENPPTLIDLKADMSEAQPSHKTHILKVDKYLGALNGEQQFVRKKGRSKIVPKVIRKHAEWRYSSLSEPFLSTVDIFNLDPVTFEDRASAFQNGLVLNYQFNQKIDKIKFIDEYVRTAVDEGTIIVKVGWELVEETVLVDVPVMGMTMGVDPNTGMQTAQQVQTGVRQEEQTKPVVNKPTVEICSYRDVVVDPTCGGNMDDARFIIYSFETSLSELEKDGRYSNLDSIVFDTTGVMSEADEKLSQNEHNFKFKDEPRKKFVLHEYWGFWDYEDNGVVKPFVASWAGETMLRMEENPFPDKKLPFVFVQHLPVRGEIYGEPDGALIEDNQKIIGAVTRGIIDILGRTANGQTGTSKGALDLVNSRKHERGEAYKFNAGVHPKEAFYTEVYPEIPRSAIEVISMQNNEVESLTGVKAFNSGISGNALGSTATGVRSAMDATSKRELGILRRYASGIKQVGRKFISMNQEFLSDQEIIRITNEEFVTINREDLGGEHDISLTISTAEADNEKAQELSFMLQTMGNNQDPGITKIIQIEIARLRKMPDLAKKIEEFEPKPDPMMAKAKELEIALLEAKVRNENAKAAENTVDVDLKRAKTQSELAKARGVHSKADSEDLNFLERESGADKNHEAGMKRMDQEHEVNSKEAEAYARSQEANNSQPQ